MTAELGLARCSKGYLGLVLRSDVKIRYDNGEQAVAFTGRHLPKVWRRWSSRNPTWLVRA